MRLRERVLITITRAALSAGALVDEVGHMRWPIYARRKGVTPQ